MATPFTIYKLIILYMLEHAEGALSSSQISEFILDREYTNYFHLQQAVSELLEAEFVEKNKISTRSYYKITAEGSTTLEFFENELSSDIKKELSPDEILSNFRKTDKLIPTITIIFYYNDKDWDGPMELHDMIDFGDAKSKETLKKYISNYHINVFNINKVDDFSKFKSDLHIIFNMLKYKRNKEALYNYTMENERYFRHISNDSIRALGELLNAKELFERFIDNNKEEQDMCKALYDLINDSIQEGKEEGAQSERYKLVSSFINGAKRLGYEEEKIKEALLLDYGLSNDEIEKLL